MYTLANAVQSYLEDVTPQKAEATRRHDHLYARRVTDQLGALPASAIAPRHAFALQRSLSETPVLANRVLSFLSQVLDLAARRGHRAEANPTRALRRYREQRRTDFLRGAQRAAFLDAAVRCAALGDVTVSASCVCQMMLLAGLRLREATNLRWEEVDLERKVLRLLPRAHRGSNKADADRARPISNDAAVVLRAMPRWSAWVAPNPATGQPYVDVRKSMARICEAAGLDPSTTRHTLRHAFGTALADVGLTAEQIAPWMGHTSAASSAVYIHLTAASSRRHADAVARAVRGEGEP